MNIILRATIVYFALLFLMRVSGKRTISQTRPFDIVVLLLISQSAQPAILGDNISLSAGLITATTLLTLHIVISALKYRFEFFEKFIDGTPVMIVENGRLYKERLAYSRVDESDILEAARSKQGLERIEQIKYAVLEKSGTITVIPHDEWR